MGPRIGPPDNDGYTTPATPDPPDLYSRHRSGLMATGRTEIGTFYRLVMQALADGLAGSGIGWAGCADGRGSAAIHSAPGPRCPGVGRGWLDQACLQGEPG